MISPISGFVPLNFSVNVSVRSRQKEGSAFSGDQLDVLRRLARKIIDTRGLLQRAGDKVSVQAFRRVNGTLGGSPVVAATASASALGLDTGTATTLASIEEVNTTPTSFSPRVPKITGVTTTQATIGGIYDGAQGDDTLVFRFQNDGVVGSDRIDIEVRSTPRLIEVVTFEATDPAGTTKTLSNGLTLSLSAGSVTTNNSFRVDVFESVGSAVDPDKPLDGTGNANPELEPGQSVVPGSFTINGASIDIVSGDTLNDVLARISASSAGVTATFNSATEQVELTHNTRGSAYEIVLGTDDTGFFDAMKLSGATQVPGADNDLERALSDVAALSGIRDGTFQINGVELGVDISTDTLGDIIERINASPAGVTAAYDEDADRVSIVSDNAGVDLALVDGTSNLFAGIGIEEGTISGTGLADRIEMVHRFGGASDLPGLLEDLAKNLNELLGAVELPGNMLRDTITEVFERVLDQEGGDRLRTGLGIDFLFDDPDGEIVRIDGRRLKRATADEIELLADFLTAGDGKGKGDRKGLLPALDGVLEEFGLSLIDRLDPVSSHGLIVDLRA